MRKFSSLLALALFAGCASSGSGSAAHFPLTPALEPAALHGGGAPIRPQPEPAGPMLSQQRYLEGVIYYQKGDYEKARASWEDAVTLDPANEDAKKGLARIKDLYGDKP